MTVSDFKNLSGYYSQIEQGHFFNIIFILVIKTNTGFKTQMATRYF